jgi:hypothetical protein
MKQYTYIILITSLSLMTQSICNAQDEVKKLNFTISNQQMDSQKKGKSTAQSLQIEIDRKQMKKAKRIYIRLLRTEGKESVLVTAIDPKAFNRDKKNVKDNKVKIDKNKININLGSPEPGQYYLYVRIKDGKGKMYLDRQEITL